jgi:dCMP deaminase
MPKDSRPSWDEYFMDITRVVATRSTCLRRQVGAVVVKDKRLLTSGYNGAPQGLAHCLEVGCLRERMGISSGERHELCRGLHAEQNAIVQAALHGVGIGGSTIYCTHQPCSACAKMIINAGIRRIVVEYPYPDELARDLLKEACVECDGYQSTVDATTNESRSGSGDIPE